MLSVRKVCKSSTRFKPKSLNQHNQTTMVKANSTAPIQAPATAIPLKAKINSENGLTAYMFGQHDNQAHYKTSTAVWTCLSFFAKIQAVNGVTDLTINPAKFIAVKLNELNPAYNLVESDFNRNIPKVETTPATSQAPITATAPTPAPAQTDTTPATAIQKYFFDELKSGKTEQQITATLKASGWTEQMLVDEKVLKAPAPIPAPIPAPAQAQTPTPLPALPKFKI